VNRKQYQVRVLGEHIADAYNDFYAVVLFYLSWGSLDRSL
jgi:hypothetical protein